MVSKVYYLTGIMAIFYLLCMALTETLLHKVFLEDAWYFFSLEICGPLYPGTHSCDVLPNTHKLKPHHTLKCKC